MKNYDIEYMEMINKSKTYSLPKTGKILTCEIKAEREDEAKEKFLKNHKNCYITGIYEFVYSNNGYI